MTTQTPQPLSAGPQPKHAQLRSALAALAATSPPDHPIPSERDLMATYGVSRSTVRKAIDSLVAEGALRRAHGKGTFVAHPRLESRLHLASFSQDMRRRGRTPSTQLLFAGQVSAPAEVAAALDLPQPSTVWHLERVRLADGEPIAIEQGWYAHESLVDLGSHDLTGSLYATLRDHYGLAIDAAEQTVWGEVTDADSARLLATSENSPLLVFRRVSSSQGRPIELSISRYRGDRYQVHMSLSAA